MQQEQKELSSELEIELEFETEMDVTRVPVDGAGLERTEVGESAPSRLEDSPRPGRTKCELYETLQDLIMGAGKKHQSTRRAS